MGDKDVSLCAEVHKDPDYSRILPSLLKSPPRQPHFPTTPAYPPARPSACHHHKQVTHSERVPIATPSHPPFGSDSLRGSWLETDSVHLLMAPWHPRLSAGPAYMLSIPPMRNKAASAEQDVLLPASVQVCLFSKH